MSGEMLNGDSQQWLKESDGFLHTWAQTPNVSIVYNCCYQTSCCTMIVLVLSDGGLGQRGLRARRRKATGSSGGDIVQNRADACRTSMFRFCNVSRSVALVSRRAPPVTWSHNECCQRLHRVEYFRASVQLQYILLKCKHHRNHTGNRIKMFKAFVFLKSLTENGSEVRLR